MATSSCKDEIEQGYDRLISIASEMDLCFNPITQESPFSGTRRVVSLENKDRYQNSRHDFEYNLANWISTIRRCISSIPEEYRKYRIETYTDPYTGEERHNLEYEDSNYSSFVKYYNKIINEIEGFNGIVSKIEKLELISDTLRNLRVHVLLLSNTLQFFEPKKIFEVERYVELIFKLRDKGLSEVAVLVEEIEEKERNEDKCLSARNALEKYIKMNLGEKGIPITQGFYTNLDKAIEAELIEKEKRETIAKHYSYTSKLIHKEIENNDSNTRFAIYGILEILHNLVDKRS